MGLVGVFGVRTKGVVRIIIGDLAAVLMQYRRVFRRILHGFFSEKVAIPIQWVDISSKRCPNGTEDSNLKLVGYSRNLGPAVARIF